MRRRALQILPCALTITTALFASVHPRPPTTATDNLMDSSLPAPTVCVQIFDRWLSSDMGPATDLQKLAKADQEPFFSIILQRVQQDSFGIATAKDHQQLGALANEWDTSKLRTSFEDWASVREVAKSKPKPPSPRWCLMYLFRALLQLFIICGAADWSSTS
jgi:hypothetical protein